MGNIVIMHFGSRVKVVEAERRTASPKEGEEQTWIEFQVRQGRCVISRHDNRKAAIAAARAFVESQP